MCVLKRSVVLANSTPVATRTLSSWQDFNRVLFCLLCCVCLFLFHALLSCLLFRSLNSCNCTLSCVQIKKYILGFQKSIRRFSKKKSEDFPPKNGNFNEKNQLSIAQTAKILETYSSILSKQLGYSSWNMSKIFNIINLLSDNKVFYFKNIEIFFKKLSFFLKNTHFFWKKHTHTFFENLVYFWYFFYQKYIDFL